MKCLLSGCNNKAKKKFCCLKHKDRWHNINNPRGHFAHLKEKGIEEDDVEKDFHPYDPYSLGQE